MRTATITVFCLSMLTLSTVGRAQTGAPSSEAQSAKVTFTSRFKIDSHAARMFKISVDANAVPMDSDTLTAMLNTPAVAGAAARDVFELPLDGYSTYVKLEAASRIQNPAAAPAVTLVTPQQMVLARIEATVRGDRRVDEPTFNRFIEAIRTHLEEVLNDAVKVDRDHINQRLKKMSKRLEDSEMDRMRVWSERIQMAEHAGLAETTVALLQKTVADLRQRKLDMGIELAVKNTRADALKAELAKQDASPGAKPDVDPLAEEMEKIMRIRARQLDELIGSKFAEESEVQAAEARLSEAKIQWTQRLEELKATSPRYQLKAIVEEAAVLKAKMAFVDEALDTTRAEARQLYRYSENVDLLKDKESRLRDSLVRIETQIEDLTTQSEKLESVTVAIIGQIPDKSKPKRR